MANLCQSGSIVDCEAPSRYALSYRLSILATNRPQCPDLIEECLGGLSSCHYFNKWNVGCSNETYDQSSNSSFLAYTLCKAMGSDPRRMEQFRSSSSRRWELQPRQWYGYPSLGCL